MKFDACSKTKHHCFNFTNLEMIESIGHYSTKHRGKKSKNANTNKFSPHSVQQRFHIFLQKNCPKTMGRGAG
jgi:hypothetical protein